MEVILLQLKDLAIEHEIIFVINADLYGVAIVHQRFGRGVKLQSQRRQLAVDGIFNIDRRLKLAVVAGLIICRQLAPVCRPRFALVAPVRRRGAGGADRAERH